MIDTYHENRLLFVELTNFACELGFENKLTGYQKDGNFDEASSTLNKIDRLDELLDKIGGSSIYFEPNSKGDCTLSVHVYSQSLAGSGQSYNYTYQKEKPMLYDLNKHNYRKILNDREDVSFDMPLYKESDNDGWYFSFKYS
jgi:hypothetical protein